MNYIIEQGDPDIEGWSFKKDLKGPPLLEIRGRALPFFYEGDCISLHGPFGKEIIFVKTVHLWPGGVTLEGHTIETPLATPPAPRAEEGA